MIGIRTRWWMIVAAVLIFLVLPGPDRSPFSGAPLASKALPVFFAVILAGVFSLLYPPRRAPRLLWLMLLVLLIGGKVALAPRLIPTGWRGTYWTPTEWTTHVTTLRAADFVTQNRIRPYRIDRTIAFDGTSFSFDFLNDWPPTKRDEFMAQRDVALPLRMRWEGWIEGGAAQQLLISCRGHVRVSVGPVTILDADNLTGRTVAIPAPKGPIVIDYNKPAGVNAMMNVAGVRIVTPAPYAPAQVARGAWAVSVITLLGFLALGVFGVAFIDAYRPLLSLANALLSEPFALVTFVVVALIVMSALADTIPTRHATQTLGPYDDPLAYEGHAREVVRSGVLMLDRSGRAGPYYFYPLYSYALAGAHLLLGEDYAEIVLFNDLCIAAAIFLTWVWLRKCVSALAGIVILLLVDLLVKLPGYASSAFTDNLFVPFVLATLLAANAAMDRRSNVMFFGAGILTALTAATRPSFLMFLPFLGLWILIDRKAERIFRRFVAAATLGAGFIVAIAPFTVRNWIVSGKPILLVDGAVNLPLFITPPEGPRISVLDASGSFPGVGGALLLCLRYFRAHPVLTIITELRKGGFTFGIPLLGPPGGLNPPWHFIIYPVLFVLAVWLKRVPRNFQSIVVIFLLSHLTAMVAAAPWTYGYKTIIPFHVVMLVGIAFLLPRRRADGLPAGGRQMQAEPTVAVIAVTDDSTPAAIRRAIADATGGYILFAEDGRSSSVDMQRLLAYAGEFDVVDGTTDYAAGTGPARWVVAKYVGALYDDLTLGDATGRLRLVRRDVAEAIAANLSTTGKRIGVEMTLKVLEQRFRRVQIRVSESPWARMSGIDAIRTIVFASVLYRQERKQVSRATSFSHC